MSQLQEEAHNASVLDVTAMMPTSNREIYLTNIEKFNHLLNCLTGQALETVQAFPISNENYPKALDRLKSRYDNNSLIFAENIATLFDLPAVSGQSSQQLRSLVNNASALYGSLCSLGTEKQICEALLISLIMQKTDAITRRKWNESRNFDTLPSWEDCSKLLDRHCQFLESLDSGNGNQSSSQRKPNNLNSKSNRRSKQYAFVASTSSNSCSFCSSNEHLIQNCHRFKALEVVQRFEKVKSLKLCINCLSPRHHVVNCTSTFKCKVCAKPHHTLLHHSQLPTNIKSAGSSRRTEHAAMPNDNVASHSHLNMSSAEQIILATALVLVKDSSGSYQVGRALLDSCSQVNFITEEFSKKLSLAKHKHRLHVSSIGSSLTNIKYQTLTSIKSRHSNFELALNFGITNHIAYQPSSEIDISSWKVPPNTPLADEQFFKSKRVDLLLGAERWIVSGKYKGQPFASPAAKCLLSVEDTVSDQLEMMWKIEEVQSASKSWSPAHVACESLYRETVHQNAMGRIVVRLPFKDSPDCLGLTHNIALRRFYSVERRLSSNRALKQDYQEFMKQYRELGHMTRVETPKTNEPHYYIPHHCVLKPSSTSTKLRVVFDASCSTTSQRSLNDILLVGPTIQPELYLLLLQFRLHRYALTADIVKMYRQVLIDEPDRKFQYIFWRDTESDPVSTYELNTVTYGTASAPFLATRSLQYLADKFETQYPIGAALIKSSFFVDDFLGGADSIDQLTNIRHQLTAILQKGCFDLDKWHSNHHDFISDTTTKSLNLDTDTVTSALGIKWHQMQDVFLFSFNAQPGHIVTKRTILSLASSLFDPLGLLAPIILVAKIMMQELWLLRVDWDESVPQNLHSAWKTFIQDLTTLSSVKVPRYCLSINYQQVDVHGFCDASIRAYGCCIFLRSQNTSGKVTVRLFTAKSRVAPIKRKSLPKLELCGALLLAKLYQKVQPIFAQFKGDTFFWTDSQIVLHWLKQHSSTLSAFVGNRVAEIQDITANGQWRHVPTQSNPADVVSRGCNIRQLSESCWFTGPEFLLLADKYWPHLKCHNLDMEEVNKETRKVVFVNTNEDNYVLQVLSRYSSYTKMLRVIAQVQRFYHVTKNKLKNGECTLQPIQLQKTLHCIIWVIQQQFFEIDIQRLQRGNPAEGTLKHLNPFLDNVFGYQLLKVGGRLELSDISVGQRHPILLPKGCYFVELYVRHIHLCNYHAGAQALIALTRLNFWIINIREIARRVVHSCIHCVRYKPKLLNQMMGNLPIERLTPSRPFARTAVDFCGPILTYLRIRGRVPYKTYIAVFVCLSTKAAHLEAVSDLSTEAFIAALKRLIGRRGLPSDIYCDNATNFVGANNKLAELKRMFFEKSNQVMLQTFCSNQFINFNFIPPRAPHFGGLWEAAVKSAKGHLYRTLSNTRFTFEELGTALIEIEAILNSRPITPHSCDPSDYEALTPAHFLIGGPLKTLSEPSPQYEATSLIDKWSRITAVKHHFWRRWSRDYLNELQIRTKWTEEQSNITEGALVLIHEDNMPPQRWLMGRIVHFIRGPDNLVRVVDVQTPKGIIRRPIHKLALLPIENPFKGGGMDPWGFLKDNYTSGGDSGPELGPINMENLNLNKKQTKLSATGRPVATPSRRLQTSSGTSNSTSNELKISSQIPSGSRNTASTSRYVASSVTAKSSDKSETKSTRRIPPSKKAHNDRRMATRILQRVGEIPADKISQQQASSLEWAKSILAKSSNKEASKPDQVSKRQRSQEEEPPLTKKPRGYNVLVRPYSEVAKDNLIIGVLDRSAEEGRIPKDKWKWVSAALADIFLQVLEENPGPAPSCEDAGWHQGQVKLVACKDARSVALYKAAVSKVGEIWPGARLEAVDKKDIPSRPRARVWIPTKQTDPEQILKIIRICNPNLPTGNWKVVKLEEPVGPTRQAVLVLNAESLKPLTEAKYVISYGFEKLNLKVYRTDATEEPEKITSAQPLLEEPAKEPMLRQQSCEETQSEDLPDQMEVDSLSLVSEDKSDAGSVTSLGNLFDESGLLDSDDEADKTVVEVQVPDEGASN
ncbi:uncharacterized protein LOC119663631 [Teleopsis dalmanni]|uniref:uncharacterized protein LOC119663631 n=1 Tax=Teleopsis dalmanni TaxID=139649 RepID=UPI0018CCCEBC|nr:uncharacterized protein LOC119663631 [Teleopsis dalmanni]